MNLWIVKYHDFQESVGFDEVKDYMNSYLETNVPDPVFTAQQVRFTVTIAWYRNLG